MATAINFQALMAEEKRKMLCVSAPTAVCTDLVGSSEGAGLVGMADGHAWQAHPDRAVNLALGRPPIGLEDYRVENEGGVDGVYYIPGFVSDEEAVDLLKRIDEMPQVS